MQIGGNGNIFGYNYTLLGIVKMKFVYGILSEQGVNAIHIMLYKGTVSNALDFDEKLFEPIGINVFESYEKEFEAALEEVLKQLLDGAIDKQIDGQYPNNKFANEIANFSNITINENNKSYTLFGIFQKKYSYFILFDKETELYSIQPYKTSKPILNFQNQELGESSIQTFDKTVKSYLLGNIEQIIMGKCDVFIENNSK